MNTWKPGQRAMVEVEVEEVWPAGDLLIRLDGAHLVVPTADLLPVSAPDADTIERLTDLLDEHPLHSFDPRTHMARCGCGDWEESTFGRTGWVFNHRSHLVDVIAAAGLLAAREPGRSEAESDALAEVRELAVVQARSCQAQHRADHARNWLDVLAIIDRAVQVTGTEGGK